MVSRRYRGRCGFYQGPGLRCSWIDEEQKFQDRMRESTQHPSLPLPGVQLFGASGPRCSEQSILRYVDLLNHRQYMSIPPVRQINHAFHQSSRSMRHQLEQTRAISSALPVSGFRRDRRHGRRRREGLRLLGRFRSWSTLRSRAGLASVFTTVSRANCNP